ncbi:winged helix-turn-helix domain-containing protein [Nocardiopsis oceani]
MQIGYAARMAEPDPDPPQPPSPAPRRRRPATAMEAKALSHQLRLRILRLCLARELTNKELADRLDTTPGTVLYHVRHLVGAGLLVAAPVRTGTGGALEKPYRATGESWWLDGPLQDMTGEERIAPVTAFQEELAEAGADSVRTYARFVLHLNDEELDELDQRLLAVIDEYMATDDQRLDRPAYGGAIILHRTGE